MVLVSSCIWFDRQSISSLMLLTGSQDDISTKFTNETLRGNSAEDDDSNDNDDEEADDDEDDDDAVVSVDGAMAVKADAGRKEGGRDC